MEEDFYDFVDNRINNNYNKLSKHHKWKNKNESFDIKYENLKKQLTEKQQKDLEDILNIKDLLCSYENTFAYSLGVNDTIKLIKM